MRPEIDSMSAVSDILTATCRVDVESKQLGTAFWIAERHLLTAAHVVTGVDRTTVTVVTEDGKRLEARVTDQNTGSDLAVLEVEERPDDVGLLSVSSEPPKIGSEVTWSGYARLIGEDKVGRQRFGWGPVASDIYSDDGGQFFEVDGLFNPGHSGGPVVELETGEVVGVVSASAGNFEELLARWDDRVHRLENLFTVTSEISGSNKSGFLGYDSLEDAVIEKDILEGYGLDVELAEQGEDVFLRFDLREASVLASKIQAEMARTLLDIALKTFQMGVGVASGGRSLSDLAQRFS